MTEKELARLKRPDLLALLVAQGRETGALQKRFEETELRLSQAVQLDNRLKAKLDEKDRRIELLNAQVEELISGRFLEINGAVTLSDIAFKLDLMLRAAQKATDRYLSNNKQTDRETVGYFR